jgi:DNA-binding winged helix-turn-helix (wHTH) protein/Tol biopolymer transport system component
VEQSPTPQLLKFGPYLVDLAAGEVRKNGHRIRLQENPLRVLALLAEKPGQLVTREELRKHLWPADTFVDFENGLNAAVSKLREAISDSSENPKYIETIPRRGYRFLSPVEIVPANGNGLHPSITQNDEATSGARDTDTAIAKSASAPATFPERRSPFATWKLLFVAGLLACLLSALVVYKFINRRPVFNLQTMRITTLTDSGQVTRVSISPDGQYIVHDLLENAGRSLWVRNVATKSEARVLRPKTAAFYGLTFSPDGDYINFVQSNDLNEESNDLYAIPVLGGVARLLLKDIDTPIGYSPDGKQFVFMRGNPDIGTIEVRTANSDGSGDTLLASFPTISTFVAGASWSPDGKTIAVPVLRAEKETKWTLVAINVADHAVRNLYSGPEWIGRPAWLPDGNSLIVPMGLLTENRTQLFVVSFPSGEKSRFTNDLSDYGSTLELTRNGQTLVTLARNKQSHIWTLPQGDTSRAKQITSGETPDSDVVPGPFGKLLLRTRRSDLVLIDQDGGNRTLLRPATRNYVSAATCGDRYIIFDSYENNKVRLMRTDADGSNAVQLADALEDSADCSPDGNWLIYQHANKIYRLPIEGGAPITLSSPPAPGFLAISPDGQWIALTNQQTGPVLKETLEIIPAAGGASVHTFTFDAPMDGNNIRWAPDQKGIQYLLTTDGTTNVWEQPLSGGPPRQITNFTSGLIFAFSWSRDGQQMYLARGSTTSDVVLVSNFR